MNKRSKTVISLLAVICISIVIFVLRGVQKKEKTLHSDNTPVNAESVKEQEREIDSELERLKTINNDIQGILKFDSGLIHEPVLQAENNDYYLYLNWATNEYQSYGSIVLDYENNINNDDMNTIIYGHYVYESVSQDRTLAFTPLAQLIQEENYEANKNITLVTENDIRHYVIVSVYDCPLEYSGDDQTPPDELQYNLVEYDETYFNQYLETIKEHEFYHTGETIDYGDRLLTLQTCIEQYPDSREIVLCKEISREDYE